MPDEQGKPSPRFDSLDRAAAGSDDGEFDPVQTARGIWFLLRLVLTGSALVVGGFMSSCGLFLTTSTALSVPHGGQTRRVSGEVIGARKSRGVGRKSKDLYAPTVRFYADGRARVFTSRLATSDQWPVGRRVTVLYDPADPEGATLAGWDLWRTPVEWTTIGIPLLAAGIVLWRRRWWLRPDSWW